MNRAKRIALRGALGNALNIGTFGFFPAPANARTALVNLTTATRVFVLSSIRSFSLTYRRNR